MADSLELELAERERNFLLDALRIVRLDHIGSKKEIFRYLKSIDESITSGRYREELKAVISRRNERNQQHQHQEVEPDGGTILTKEESK